MPARSCTSRRTARPTPTRLLLMAPSMTRSDWPTSTATSGPFTRPSSRGWTCAASSSGRFSTTTSGPTATTSASASCTWTTTPRSARPSAALTTMPRSPGPDEWVDPSRQTTSVARVNTPRTPSSQGSPTLDEVARVAGVSRATASRAINGGQRVSARAQSSVDAAVRSLGYVPNPAARSLVTRRTDSIAVVVPEPDDRVFSDPFFAGTLRGVTRVLGERDIQLVLLLARPGASTARTLRYLTNRHVDGALVVSHHRDDRLAEHLADLGLPCVFGGRPWTGGGPVAPLHGEDDAVEHGDFTEESGVSAARMLMERHPDLDGLVVASALMAAGALRVLAELGRRVPDDIAVVGYDALGAAEGTPRPLTPAGQRVEEMAERATPGSP